MMDSIKDTCIRYGPYIGGGVIALGATVFIIRRWRHTGCTRKLRVCGIDYPKDTVIVHQEIKGKHAPSLGHFVMKLQTYLRMAKIPYEPVYDPPGDYRGPKGKIPWIEYNGQEIGDSQLTINYLNKEFGVDLNKHLTPKEKASAWAIQKWLEEFTYWLNVRSRWVIHIDDFYGEYTAYPLVFKSMAKKTLHETTYTIGVGRHSDEEVDEMLNYDLRMLS